MSSQLIKAKRVVTQQNIQWASVWSLAFFFAYVLTSAKVNVGYADSDMLLATAFNGGLAHPPGYPLYMWLLHKFLSLPFPTSIAQKGHIFSAIWGSLTLAVAYLSSSTLYESYKKTPTMLISKKFETWLVSSLTTILLGSGYLFWTYSHVTEKYSFAAFFTALTTFGVIKLFTSDKTLAWTRFTAIALGLGIAHHQSLLLLIVGVVVAVFHNTKSLSKKSLVKSASLGVLAYVASYLIALIIISRGAPISWEVQASLEGLYKLITRREFAGELYSISINTGAYWSGIDIPQHIQSLIGYVKVLYTQTQAFLLLPALALLVHSNKRSKLTEVLMIMYGFLGIGLAAYMVNLVEDYGSQAVSFRQYIPGIVVLYIALVPGWRTLIEKILQAGQVLRLENRAKQLILVALIGLVGYSVATTLPKADMAEYTLVSERYSSILSSLKENALLTCYSDTSCFALIYEQSVNSLRKDVDIIPMAYPFVANTLNQDNIRSFTYTSNPYLLFDIVSWNIGQRPVYAVEIDSYFYNFLGLEYPFLYYIPYEQYGEFAKTAPDSLNSPSYEPTEKWKSVGLASYDPMQLHHVASLGRDHLLNASFYIKYDYREFAQEALNKAGDIFFNIGDTMQNDIDAVQSQIALSQPLEDFSPGSRVKTVDELLELIDRFNDNQQFSRSYLMAHAAVLSDAKDVRSHIALAQIFEERGDIYFARKQYQAALKLDESNASASAALDRLSDVQEN